MIPAFLLSFVEGKVGAKFAKPLIYGAGVLVLLLAIFAAVKIHDHRVIANHEAKQDASNAKADRAADTKAADQRMTDQQRLQDEKQQTQEAINEARRNGSDPRAAYYACVAKQQTARRQNAVVPSC